MVCARTEHRITLIVLIVAASILNAWPGDAYPWVHYFKRPEMPRIRCAFADPEGNVLVGTGDWDNTRAGPSGYYWREFWSEGIFLINEDRIQAISCPEDMITVDLAADRRGKTWALIATGQDYLVEKSLLDLGSNARCTSLQSRRIARSRSSGAVDSRLAYLVGTTLVEYTGLIDAIPYHSRSMTSDAQGRLFVLSGEQVGWYFYQYAISWWDAEEPIEIHTLDFSNILPDAEMVGVCTDLMGEYPVFGPDGLVYIAAEYSLDEESRTCGVLCLNLDTEEWLLFSGGENPLLDSKLEYFYVDQMNRRWFCTEDGLVLFDGENWVRFTTDNSDLSYDRIKLVVYDEIDEVYYVGSAAEDWQQDPDHYVALSVFAPNGRQIGEPFYLPRGPILRRGANGIHYLLPGWDDDLVYAYDHDRISEFSLRDWMDIPEYSAWDLYIFPTSVGDTFFVTNYSVMIW